MSNAILYPAPCSCACSLSIAAMPMWCSRMLCLAYTGIFKPLVQQNWGKVCLTLDRSTADMDTPAAAPEGAGGAAEAPVAMSKRQLKRQAKMERQQEAKKARRAAEKEEKKKAQEAKKADIGKMLEGMTDEQKQQWHQQQKEKKQQIMAARQAAKEHNKKAIHAPQKVVIDLDFQGLMNPSEIKSLLQQLSYSYNAAVSGPQQLHLHLLGATGDLEAALSKQLPGHIHWAATKSEKNFKEFFQEKLSDLVYLTADSPDELTQLDSSKIYIIGGIVDRNRHKGICYQRAKDAGIATAKLPIAQHVKLQSSAVITVNQVVDILVKVQASNDWKAVLEEVLPGRKRVEPAAAVAEAAPAAEADRKSATAAASMLLVSTAEQDDAAAAQGSKAVADQQESASAKEDAKLFVTATAVGGNAIAKAQQ